MCFYNGFFPTLSSCNAFLCPGFYISVVVAIILWTLMGILSVPHLFIFLEHHLDLRISLEHHPDLRISLEHHPDFRISLECSLRPLPFPLKCCPSPYDPLERREM
jgi:hypothetical protein